ncbi:LysR family transcriptional regulator [Eggerthellaceae bacterium 3-80]
MDIRTMQYFLAIAQEGSFKKAAEHLHMTQPPLSRQIQDLETELGVTLFDRGRKGVTLTEAGMRFMERAQEAVDLMGQIKSDMTSSDSDISGEVRIACGESDAVAFLAKVAEELRASHLGITYRLLSGDGEFVTDKLDRGAADIGLLVTSSINNADYGFMEIPAKDTWGVLMADNAALAKLSHITPDNLVGEPLLLPYRASMGSDLMTWFKDKRESLNVVATYDLAYNASRFAKEGFGYVVALDGIVDTTEGSGLTFRPLAPHLEACLFLVWNRRRRPTRAVEAFLEAMRAAIEGVAR